MLVTFRPFAPLAAAAAALAEQPPGHSLDSSRACADRCVPARVAFRKPVGTRQGSPEARAAAVFSVFMQAAHRFLDPAAHRSQSPSGQRAGEIARFRLEAVDRRAGVGVASSLVCHRHHFPRLRADGQPDPPSELGRRAGRLLSRLSGSRRRRGRSDPRSSCSRRRGRSESRRALGPLSPRPRPHPVRQGNIPGRALAADQPTTGSGYWPTSAGSGERGSAAAAMVSTLTQKERGSAKRRQGLQRVGSCAASY